MMFACGIRRTEKTLIQSIFFLIDFNRPFVILGFFKVLLFNLILLMGKQLLYNEVNFCKNIL